MSSLSRAKSLGEAGSILVLLTAVPSVGAVLGIVGFVLILVAIKNISEVVADKAIFNDMLISIGLAIAGIVVGTLVVVGSVLRFVGLNNLSLGPNFNSSTVPSGDWVGLIGSVLIGLGVVWAMLLASAVYVRRAYGEISSKLGVKMFETAGLVYLIGAATTILLIGFVLLLVAQILVVVAFFSIEDRPPAVAGQPSPTPPASQPV
jgi:uncharacterized membrane protein